MFRLTAYLIIAIGTTMYFADEIASPSADSAMAAKSDVVAPVISVAEIAEKSLGADATPIAFSIPANTVKMSPIALPTPETVKAATLVSFSQPAVVNLDGTIKVPEPIALARAVAQPVLMQGEPKLNVQYVTAQRVNVRQGPSTEHPVLGKVVYDEAVQVLSDPAQEWVLVRIEGDGIEGYMSSKFLQETAPQN